MSSFIVQIDNQFNNPILKGCGVWNHMKTNG